MKIKQIEPVKVIMRLYGHEIEIVITRSTHSEVHMLLNDKVNETDILQLDDIINGLSEDLCNGQISSAAKIILDGHDEETTILCEGNWRVIPDYRLWKRIFSWWYSHDFNEALSFNDFTQCYGTWKGGHYFDKWASFERNIPKMIGYIGNNMEEGRAFLDMLMQKVRQFENRINNES